MIENSDEHSLKVTEIYAASEGTPIPLPSFESTVPAGFPSPADDYLEKRLDINELVIKHPNATFFVKVEGDSMRDAGIQSGDTLVVDRSIEPAHGKIVVAILNGEFTVKRLLITPSGILLSPENSTFSAIHVQPESDFQVWGIVTYVIHKAS
jgi:DNA polymerase V